MLNDINSNALTGLIIGIVTILVYLHVCYKQMYEVLSPKDWLTRLRWLILLSLLTAVLGFAPALIYQFCRAFGIDAEGLRNFANITGNISRLAGAVFIELVFNYKRKS